MEKREYKGEREEKECVRERDGIEKRFTMEGREESREVMKNGQKEERKEEDG